MTTPNLAVPTPYGRLYHKPGIDPATLPDHLTALQEGLLFPSVTNIIGVLDKPFLATWQAKEVALAAVDLAQTHPGLVVQKPKEAEKWLKAAADRKSKAAAELGDLVHNTVEALAAGQEPTTELTAKAKLYVKSYHKFVADYQPEFLHLESTCYGTVPTSRGELGYAGTADFIARIDGKNYICDWKTGRSIHTEAALQACALAHATEIVDIDETRLEPMPQIDGGLIVHLTPNGYFLYPANIGDEPWETFGRLRDVWDFHQANLTSRTPLLLGDAVTGIADLTNDPFTKGIDNE